MHSRVREIVDYLEARRVALRSAIETVDPERRTRRPAPDVWSVAEVVEHLALVEARVLERFGTALGEARANGLGEERQTGPIEPTLDLPRLTDRTRRIAASESVQPRGAMDADAAWAELGRVRDGTLAAIRDADGLALAEVTMPHPIVGALNLYQWLLFLGAHEDRHAAQIRAIGRSLSSSSPGGTDG